jgi:cellulose synthase/poly-beta-1,6-N-acetylglucosamine synthase-like glycosyltransferase
LIAAFLLAGLFAVPIATLAMFVRTPRLGAAEGAWPATRRMVFAVLMTAGLAVVVAAALLAIGVTSRNVTFAVAGLIVVSVAWLPLTRRWSGRAHVCWSATTFLFAAYLVFMIDWTFASHLGAGGTIGGVILWLLEVFAALLGCAYLWELCDAIGRERWIRRPSGALPVEAGQEYFPFVSLHVPAHYEPPDMVIETLKSLKALDYPAYEIIAIDDNTGDETLWRPLEAWCRDNNVKFVHLEDWPGYKSGALNYALRHVIDPRTELIGIIDADYQVDSQFLRVCAPFFADENLGFLQTPQDYRDWEHAPFYRRLYFSYLYFFAVSQPSRNERGGAIFAGTMGLIRRRALEAVGGWDEWCITEDAELSLRLLRSGWSGTHIDRSFGRGVMPLTLEALKGQRFRWCFGGIQILRKHWRWMMPGRVDNENQMTAGQRWAYLSGAVQWYGDLLGLVFFMFLVVGGANIAFGGGLLFRKLTGFLIGAIPLLVVLGLVRAVALLRRSTGASWRDAFGAFMIWQCTALIVARASVQALFAKQAMFVRTPKTAEEAKWSDAIRGNLAETGLAILGVLAIGGALSQHSGLGGPLVALLLLWPTLAFAAAPYNSLAAQRAALPPELQARRRTEYQRSSPARKVTIASGGLAVAAASTAAVVALLSSPGGTGVLSPPLVGPARGHSAVLKKPAATAKPTPSPSAPSKTAPASAPADAASAPASSAGDVSSPTARPTHATPTPTAAPSPTATPAPSATPTTTTPTASATAPTATPTAPAAAPTAVGSP